MRKGERRKVTDFVRRRRWVRTQRPATSDHEKCSPSAQAGGNGDASAAGGGGHGSPSPVRRPQQLLEALSYPSPAPVRDPPAPRLLRPSCCPPTHPAPPPRQSAASSEFSTSCRLISSVL